MSHERYIMNTDINWANQHCGVHQAPIGAIDALMPEVYRLIINTFPDNPDHFTWDIKVHMLMPNQYPCIPNWHVDNIPRPDGRQDFTNLRLDRPMYLWLSGPPLTEFRSGFVQPQKWVRFTQADEHRGTASDGFKWRCFIRATHRDIMQPKEGNWLRRHSQVYLDAETYKW